MALSTDNSKQCGFIPAASEPTPDSCSAAENEAYLASVMAREIAHVAACHATKNATRAQM
jgi:hypothetical protein